MFIIHPCNTVTLFAHGGVLVLDRVLGAVLNTGHAVRAAFVLPNRLSVLHFDHIHRTKPDAFLTGNTLLRCAEALCFLVKITQHRRNRDGYRVFEQEQMKLSPPHISTDTTVGIYCYII